ARHGLHVRRVQQPHLHDFFQAVERRLPIRRRGLHRRDTHPSLDQPVPHHPQCFCRGVDRRLPIRRRGPHPRDPPPTLDQPVPHHPQRPCCRFECARFRVPPPLGLGVRRHTVTVSLPTSSPATRSNITSI